MWDRIMKAFYHNCFAKITQASKEEVATAKEILGYSPKGVRYSKKFQEGVWDGTLSLIKHRVFPSQQTLPTGQENPGFLNSIK